MSITKERPSHFSPVQKRRYNLEDVKSIPILEVCDQLGLQVEKKGRSYWCKVRPERTSSVVVHPENNTFYDFGSHEHGSAIDLVCYATELPFSDAVRLLGDTFGLEPLSSEEKRYQSQTMGRVDYERIGLYSDLATKNFTFPVETCTLDQLERIEQKYSMSMNELRQKHPGVYERVLRERAVPHVNRMRNDYYFAVWSRYQFLKAMGAESMFFDSESTQGYFCEHTKDLERAEASLYKAARNTGIRVEPAHKYDPMRVISHLLQDRLTIHLGNNFPFELETASKKEKQNISTLEITYDELFQDPLDKALADVPHCINVNKNGVQINCFERDLPQLQCAVEGMRAIRSRLDLNGMIDSAKSQKNESFSWGKDKEITPSR